MSKELEALEKINYTVGLNVLSLTLNFGLMFYDHSDCKDLKEFRECYELIKKALKALEIVKEKNIYVSKLLVCFKEGGLERYNNYLDRLYFPECHPEYHLTQEEFDLLKEVL